MGKMRVVDERKGVVGRRGEQGEAREGFETAAVMASHTYRCVCMCVCVCFKTTCKGVILPLTALFLLIYVCLYISISRA